MRANDVPREKNALARLAGKLRGALLTLARKLWRALLTLVGAGLAGVIALVAVAAYHLYQLPLTTEFRDPSRPALTLLTRDGRTFAVRGATQGREVALKDLPPYLVDAVIAMEDRRFFEHSGVDPRGLLRAAYRNLIAGRVVQGGSTITQQVARLEFLSAEKTFTRKIQEALLALWMEQRLSKEEILTRYLNAIYLGAGTHGVDAASRRYFGRPAVEISLSEAAMLAGLIQAPSRFAPTGSPETAQRRAELVLDAMVAQGRLDAATAAQARERPAALAVRPIEEDAFGHVADWAAAEARARLAGIEGDFRVSTTIDPALQRIAVDAVGLWLAAEGAEGAASQAALVALGPDGRVRAMVGGADYAASQFNRAVQARRQPGSSFKLFVYLAALEAGFDPESRVDDRPIRIGKWSPKNYTGRYHGRTTLTRAFAKSYNAAAVALQEEIGRERVVEQARKLGIRSPLGTNPSLALGTHEVTLLELTAAYAAVRAGEGPIEPYVLTGIESLGATRLEVTRREERVPLAAGAKMRRLLREVVTAGTGRASLLTVESYGKTGTSQDNRDAWFIGFAGDMTVGVWVGNDDGSPMRNVTGGRLPARIWRDFMVEALRLNPAQETILARARRGELTAAPEVQVAAGPPTPAATPAAASPAQSAPPVAPKTQAAAPQKMPVPEPESTEPPAAPALEVAAGPAEPADLTVEAPPGALAAEAYRGPLPQRRPAVVAEAAVPLAPPVVEPEAYRGPLPQRRPRVVAETVAPPPRDVVHSPPQIVAVPPKPVAKPQGSQLASTQPAPTLPRQAAVEPAMPPPPLPRAKPRPAPEPQSRERQLTEAAPRNAKESGAQPKAPPPPKEIARPDPETQPKAPPPPKVIARPEPEAQPKAPAPPKVIARPDPEAQPKAPPPPKVIARPDPEAQPKAPAPPKVIARPDPEVQPQAPTPPEVANRSETVPAAPPEKVVREILIGIPSILDTATLQIGPDLVRLEGVEGIAGPAVREMAEYIGGREVSCRRTTERRFRCEVDGWDLSEVVLFNGGGRARATASAELVAAEVSARNARRGVWSR